MKANWSEEEIKLLKRTYPIKTASEMAEIFPQYSSTQIYRKARALGVKKKKEVAYRSRLENSIIKREDLWTDEEKKVVIEHYGSRGASGVRELLNNSRSEYQIKRMAHRLGVTRDEKNLMWEQTHIQLKKTSGFSVEVVFRGR